MVLSSVSPGTRASVGDSDLVQRGTSLRDVGVHRANVLLAPVSTNEIKEGVLATRVRPFKRWCNLRRRFGKPPRSRFSFYSDLTVTSSIRSGHALTR